MSWMEGWPGATGDSTELGFGCGPILIFFSGESAAEFDRSIRLLPDLGFVVSMVDLGDGGLKHGA
jgi:hypothetical protein